MRWRRAFGSTPLKHTSLQFLQKVLAHDLQCKAHGDVPKRVQKTLNAVVKSSKTCSSNASEFEGTSVDGHAWCETDHGTKNGYAATGTNTAATPLPTVLTPGVQLVREWNGRTWQVEVLEEGFVCNDKSYRSLSAIARMITGTRWSGPRFFGLNR